jgi:hypothetical protein
MKIPIPIKGKYVGVPIAEAPVGTSGDLKNVRPRDVAEGRLRIGQRPGLDKWSTDQLGGADAPIVAIGFVSSAN